MLTEAQKTVIENCYGYHAPKTPEQREQIAANRRLFAKMEEDLIASIPPGRELSIAKTNLEQASFWANAAIARSWGPAEPFGA